MNRIDNLLKRLDDIGQSLAQSGQGLALIGLGSVGTELDRLDNYSDLGQWYERNRRAYLWIN